MLIFPLVCFAMMTPRQETRFSLLLQIDVRLFRQ